MKVDVTAVGVDLVRMQCEVGVSEGASLVRVLVAVRVRMRPFGAVVRELLHPPEWWMHAYYNVPPGQSLTHARLVRHPRRVACWLALRALGL
jgi:hypothetical protein